MRALVLMLRPYLAFVDWVSRWGGFAAGNVVHAVATAVLTAGFAYGYSRGTVAKPPNELGIVLAAGVTVAMLVHAVLYGMLRGLGIPSPLPIIRGVNRMFEGGELRDAGETGAARYILLYKQIVRIPVVRIFTSISDVAITLSPVVFYDIFFMGGEYWLHYCLVALIALPIHGQFCYVTADLHLGPVRSLLKRRIFEMGQRPPNLYALSLKFKFILVLSVILLAAYILYSLLLVDASRAKVWWVLVCSLFALLLLITLTAMYFSSIFIAVDELQHAAQELKKGRDPDFFSSSSDREFARLSHGFFDASQKVLNHQKQLEQKVEERTVELSKQKARLEKVNQSLKEKDRVIQQELDFAAEIQSGMLPDELPSWNGLNFAVTYLPMGKVSGDYYDIFDVGDSLFVLIADVSGHGVPAALITMAANQAFSRAVAPDKSPAEVLKQVNEELCQKIQTQDYLTAFMMKIDRDHNVVYTNAAHQKAVHYVRAKKGFKMYDSPGLLVGALDMAGETYENREFKMTPGDRIILYTDGIVEHVNEAKEEYGHKRFLRTIQEAADWPLDELNKHVVYNVIEYLGQQTIKDDITVFSIDVGTPS